MIPQTLWDAFPVGYLPIVGTSTIGKQQVVRGKDGQCLWFWPTDIHFSKPGFEKFDDLRPKGWFLPDLTDDVTRTAITRVLAERVNMDATCGVLWFPKTTETVDHSRGSASKAILGWTIRSIARQAFFPMPDEKNGDTALLQAIAMTNCACGRGSKKNCPMHGENRARPWRP